VTDGLGRIGLENVQIAVLQHLNATHVEVVDLQSFGGERSDILNYASNITISEFSSELQSEIIFKVDRYSYELVPHKHLAI
jgi:hypothetical protein